MKTAILLSVLFLFGCDDKDNPNGGRNLPLDVGKLEVENDALRHRLEALEARLSAINYAERLSQIVQINKDGDVVITGANLQLVNGSGKTYDEPNGKGNLIIGYNELAGPQENIPTPKTGSHNLVVGKGHSYTGTGGFVAGNDNSIGDRSSSILGGGGNIATAYTATIVGGIRNKAISAHSIVVGGLMNTTDGQASIVVGGKYNESSGEYSVISGGEFNKAEGLAPIGGGRYARSEDFSSIWPWRSTKDSELREH